MLLMDPRHTRRVLPDADVPTNPDPLRLIFNETDALSARSFQQTSKGCRVRGGDQAQDLLPTHVPVVGAPDLLHMGRVQIRSLA